MTHNIFLRGTLWKLERTRRGLGKSKKNPTGLWGLCCKEAKTIKVLPDEDFETVEKTAETIIHEMLHGLWWDLDEEAVTQAAKEIATALQVSGLLTDKKDHQ